MTHDTKLENSADDCWWESMWGSAGTTRRVYEYYDVYSSGNHTIHTYAIHFLLSTLLYTDKELSEKFKAEVRMPSCSQHVTQKVDVCGWGNKEESLAVAVEISRSLHHIFSNSKQVLWNPPSSNIIVRLWFVMRHQKHIHSLSSFSLQHDHLSLVEGSKNFVAGVSILLWLLVFAIANPTLHIFLQVTIINSCC